MISPELYDNNIDEENLLENCKSKLDKSTVNTNNDSDI